MEGRLASSTEDLSFVQSIGGLGEHMAGSVDFIITCFVFFIGALGAAYVPFLVVVTEAKLRLITLVGAGLLVGAALQTIIPEGFEAFYNNPANADDIKGYQFLPGLLLVVGFLTMLILDRVQTGLIPGGGMEGVASVEGSDALDAAESGAAAASPAPPRRASTQLREKGEARCVNNVVTGLIVHAAADGLSLGAASLSHNTSLEVVVALALMLHKAPVAFGLSTYLTSVRCPWSRSRHFIAAFASATPIVGLITYFGLGALPFIHSSVMSVPLCLLFSGGTVLYAACMHIIPEALSAHHNLTNLQLLCFVLGAIMPVGLALLPEHAH